MPLTVIVPARNERRNIGNCLQALAAQTRVPDQVIVVDNGSTDGTGDFVRSERARYPHMNVELTIETAPGPAAARNCGIRMAQGSIIAFTDADCIPEPQWTARIVELFEQHPELAALGGIESGSELSESLMARVLTSTWLPSRQHHGPKLLTDIDAFFHGDFIATFPNATDLLLIA